MPKHLHPVVKAARLLTDLKVSDVSSLRSRADASAIIRSLSGSVRTLAALITPQATQGSGATTDQASTNHGRRSRGSIRVGLSGRRRWFDLKPCVSCGQEGKVFTGRKGLCESCWGLHLARRNRAAQARYQAKKAMMAARPDPPPA